MNYVEKYFGFTSLAAGMLFLFVASSPAKATGLNPLDPILTDIGSPIPGLHFAVGLGSDLDAHSTVDLSNPLAPVVSNAAGSSFRFQLAITLVTAGTLGPDHVDFIFDPNVNLTVGGTLSFFVDADPFAVQAFPTPTTNLLLSEFTFSNSEGIVLVLQMDYAFGADPPSSVTFDLCCNSASAPLAFPGVQAIPEPGSLALTGAGLLALALRRRPGTTCA